jgi:glycosyltransferase involved in cell wall biosynthesis
VSAGAYTVVIPAYNAAPFIAETIASVLAQTVSPERIIVIDDGSADDTASVVASLEGPITCVRQENMGPGGATTLGIAMTDTEFVATLDQDDLWLPAKAEFQLAHFKSDPAVAAVFGRVVEFRGDPSSARHETAHDGWTRATLMIRTRIAKEAGPIVDTPNKLGEMIDWLTTLREGGHRLAMANEVLTLRRLHEGSLTARDRAYLSRSYIAVARRALLRRRGSAPTPR